ncbi:MAG: hypothetical protein U5Q44_08105 [Dehalococcoidia bacterium]|nr:hypothetical protein [Dehalococcoidia bacterium]
MSVVALGIDGRLEHEAVEHRLGDGRVLEMVGHGEGRVEPGILLLLALGKAALVEDAEEDLEDEVVGVHELVEVREVGGEQGVRGVVPELAFVEELEVDATEDGLEAGALGELRLEGGAAELAEDALAVEGLAGAGARDEELVAAREEGKRGLLEQLGAARDRFGDVEQRGLEGLDGLGEGY